MMRKIYLLAGALALGAAFAVQAATPAQTIEARQKNFKSMGKAMKETGDSFKSGTPDAALIKANAVIIASFSDKIPTWFPAGTATGGATKTAAKPEIWTDKAGFAQAAANFAAASKAYKAVADTGGTCKGCHEKFKLKD
jgi:cytochrome c556